MQFETSRRFRGQQVGAEGGGWFSADSPRRGHARIHDARVSGLQDRRVQVILLDTRHSIGNTRIADPPTEGAYAELKGDRPRWQLTLVHRYYMEFMQ